MGIFTSASVKRRSPTDIVHMVWAVSSGVLTLWAVLMPTAAPWALLLVALLLWPMLYINSFQDRRWMMCAVSCLWRGMVSVELIDCTGDVRYSIARIGCDGRLVCPVHWFLDVGECILNPDGRVDPASESFHVYFWMPLRRCERVAHLLSYDLPDFSILDGLGTDERTAMMRAMKKSYDQESST